MNQLVYVKNTVVRGFGRGSKELGCPTANVEGANEVNLPTGIYCGLAQLVIRNKDEIQPEPGFEEAYQKVIENLPYISSVQGMVCSFGYNPQYGNKERSLEVHILENFQFNFYQAEVRVLICKRMRDEEKYNSLEELKQAIANDIRNAELEVPNYLKNASNRDYFIEVNNNDDRFIDLKKDWAYWPRWDNSWPPPTWKWWTVWRRTNLLMIRQDTFISDHARHWIYLIKNRKLYCKCKTFDGTKELVVVSKCWLDFWQILRF